MSKLSQLFRSIWKSTTSLRYYKEVYSMPMANSVKYYVWFSFVFGILLTLLTSGILIPPANKFAQRFEKRAPLLFPESAIIEIKDGELTTNMNEPLRIPLPYELFFDVPPAITDQDQIYLLTINTLAKPGDFSKSQSLLVLTDTLFAIKDHDNRYQSIPLSEVGDVKIDKAQADNYLNNLNQILHWVPVIIIFFGIAFFVVFLTLYRAFAIMITSLVLMPIAKWFLPDTNFGRISTLAFTASTLPTLLQTLMYAFGVIPPIPFFYSILLGLFLLIIFAELKDKRVK